MTLTVAGEEESHLHDSDFDTIFKESNLRISGITTALRPMLYPPVQKFSKQTSVMEFFWGPMLGGGLIGYVKSKPLGNGQIISIDVLVEVMIIAVFHKKLI